MIWLAIIAGTIWAAAMLVDGMARRLDDDQHAQHS